MAIDKSLISGHGEQRGLLVPSRHRTADDRGKAALRPFYAPQRRNAP